MKLKAKTALRYSCRRRRARHGYVSMGNSRTFIYIAGYRYLIRDIHAMLHIVPVDADKIGALENHRLYPHRRNNCQNPQ